MSFQLTPLLKGSLNAIPLHRPVLLIGRHPECDFRIDLPKVSRRHCCLALVYDRVLIRNLGSRNGLRVNGRLVEETRLQEGDEVAIGPLLFRFEAEFSPGDAKPTSNAGRRAPTHSNSSASAQGAAPQPRAQASLPEDSEIDLVPLDEI